MLETLLGSRLRTKILGWLFSHPDERYFVRQITSLLNEDSTNVSRELARLEKTGILVLTIEGKQKYYQSNRKSPVFAELHGLVVKTAGVADVLKTALGPVRQKIRAAFIFGSTAMNTENRTSDIDLMVIGSISFAKVSSAVSQAEKILQREVNPVVYSPSEFKQKVRGGHHFLKTVLENEKIFLIGDEDEFDRLAK